MAQRLKVHSWKWDNPDLPYVIDLPISQLLEWKHGHVLRVVNRRFVETIERSRSYGWDLLGNLSCRFLSRGVSCGATLACVNGEGSRTKACLLMSFRIYSYILLFKALVEVTGMQMILRLFSRLRAQRAWQPKFSQNLHLAFGSCHRGSMPPMPLIGYAWRFLRHPLVP